MEVLPHAHPLKLIDLNPKYPHDEVVYDDEEELIMKQDFRCPCGRCGQEINFYHRKYNSFHTHPLTLAYSFPDQKAKFDPRCKVCEERFDENLWIYKCEKCRYYAHIDCASTSKKGSMVSILFNEGTSTVSKNYRDSDYPDLLHLPFPDQTSQTKVLKHLFYGESGSRAFETNLTHPFHQHPLTLVDTPCCNNDITTTPTSSRITTSSSHDSMKMVEVVCNACIRPITNMPFYKCTASDEGCNFVLHVWCTRLPTEVKMTARSRLKLLPPGPFAISGMGLGLFRCRCCQLTCNGFVYSDNDKYSNSRYEIDVYCGVTPEHITHKSHPNHLLRKLKPSSKMYCRLCLSDAKTQSSFYGCGICNFYLHAKCALLWPDTIRHKYDKHPMTLRYFPVENYNGDYFCEVCEEEFNPNAAFYHCDQCVQSIHRPCVEFIFQEATTWTPFLLDRGVDKFQNVKFGGIFTFKGHPHPLSLFRGTESDGDCTLCGDHLQNYYFILKCLQCKFAIDKKCCRKIE
ncbi:protein kinase C-like, phorbol ester/diacylglycerol-binding domain, DC1 [Artemisia annua]|uniref:Protein kinase C-like, phorbol ester/diacylglycerol-binding domain, DC1 n=1 Tax=Artemisia annua TaxID=35608 RepID=A0A2U1P7F4_ARTAN|nr:protein kinase C-like, phorbol ester/diacylglycerol-binding domain, DC1 [Artemisia annua]